VVDDSHAHRHEPTKLARALTTLLEERSSTRGPVVARTA
jgi:hypothetical protein